MVVSIVISSKSDLMVKIGTYSQRTIVAYGSIRRLAARNLILDPGAKLPESTNAINRRNLVRGL